METLRKTPIEQLQSLGKRAGLIFRGVIEIAKNSVTLPLACGYVNFDGMKRYVHDDSGSKLVSDRWGHTESYNEAKHGPLLDWVEEGQEIPGFPKGNKGETAYHDHNSEDSTGPYEFTYK